LVIDTVINKLDDTFTGIGFGAASAGLNNSDSLDDFSLNTSLSVPMLLPLKISLPVIT